MFELIITRPMGFIIDQIYRVVQNYGLAIILFTIIIKLVLMPLAIRSQKAMRKQQKLQPYLAELQKKYANDKEKLNQETMKLYKENNVSMTGGCLPLLIQFPILIGLYRVIQKPITYLLGVDFTTEVALAKAKTLFTAMTTQFPDIVGKLKGMSIDAIVKNSQIQLSTWAGIINGSTDPWVVNFGFLGLDLSVVPSVSVSYILSGKFGQLDRVLLILIPLLAMATTWLSIKQSQKMTQTPDTANQDNPAASMGKSMNIMMPLMTGFFAFSLPSGLGLYWIVSNLMQMFQQFLINVYFKKKGDDFDVKLPQKRRKNGKNN